jgi:hypothetical protein
MFDLTHPGNTMQFSGQNSQEEVNIAKFSVNFWGFIEGIGTMERRRMLPDHG